MSICLNGQRRFINLPQKFRPEIFNKKRQPIEIVEAVGIWRTRINGYITEMLQYGQPLTVDNLRRIIQTGGVQTYTVKNLFDEYLAILRKRVGVDMTHGVYRKYELVAEKFGKHIDETKEVTAITNADIRSFYALLNQSYDTSSSASMMTKLKTFITFGMDNGRLKINPFQGIKIVKAKRDITYLSEAEIRRLLQANFDNKSLQQVLDCFIIMCGTGLAYIDLRDLKKSDIEERNGTYFIHKKRVKTGEEYTAVIMPWAMERINKYDVLPVISNQKLNCYLHTIEDILGFPKSLHCHLARHSYATLLLNKRVPISTVAKTLGHSNVKMTSQFYAKVLTETVVDEISQIF